MQSTIMLTILRTKEISDIQDISILEEYFSPQVQEWIHYRSRGRFLHQSQSSMTTSLMQVVAERPKNDKISKKSFQQPTKNFRNLKPIHIESPL